MTSNSGSSLPTPRYDLKGFEDTVYEPAEDTFLLLDALEDEMHWLHDLDPQNCVEVGCGSGLPLAFLSAVLDRNSKSSFMTPHGEQHNGTDTQPSRHFLAVDINSDAIAVAARTFSLNGDVSLEGTVGDCLSPCLERGMKADVVLFNAPYVITPPEEVGGEGMVAAWAGGEFGRVVIDRLLGQLDEALSEKGVMYMVGIEENIKEGQEDDLRVFTPGFRVDPIKKRRAGPERLVVLKYTRQQHEEPAEES